LDLTIEGLGITIRAMLFKLISEFSSVILFEGQKTELYCVVNFVASQIDYIIAMIFKMDHNSNI